MKHVLDGKEIEKMVKERRNLRKQWKRATEEEMEGINVFQEEKH